MLSLWHETNTHALFSSLQFWFYHLFTSFLSVTYGLFTLPETDSGTDLDSGSKPHCYIVQCRTCSHCTDSDLDSAPYFCTGQESESESVPESVSSNVNELLHLVVPSEIWNQLCTVHNQ